MKNIHILDGCSQSCVSDWFLYQLKLKKLRNCGNFDVSKYFPVAVCKGSSTICSGWKIVINKQ